MWKWRLLQKPYLAQKSILGEFNAQVFWWIWHSEQNPPRSGHKWSFTPHWWTLSPKVTINLKMWPFTGFNPNCRKSHLYAFCYVKSIFADASPEVTNSSKWIEVRRSSFEKVVLIESDLRRWDEFEEALAHLCHLLPLLPGQRPSWRLSWNQGGHFADFCWFRGCWCCWSELRNVTDMADISV